MRLASGARGAEWNPIPGVYEINNVIGPDENHDHVDNNAYTNHMARKNLQAAFEVLEWLEQAAPEKAAQLRKQLDLTSERLAHWQDVIDRIVLGFDPQTGVYEQFKGFYQRKHVDLQDYEPRSTSMQALLGVQEAQEYQIIKQPDVLMWLYLQGPQTDPQILKTNYDFYTPRTDLTYGSSLGPAIQSILASWLGDSQGAYQSFIHAARTDLQDARGNTSDGIHAATDGGLWQAAVFGFGGLKISADGPQATPLLPDKWKGLSFQIQYQGRSYRFELSPSMNGRPAAPVDKPIKAGPAGLDLFAGTTQPGSPSLPILGAIFDLDGVLTDTSELHFQAWKRLADEEGFPFTRQDNEALRGVSRRESLLLLLKGRQLPEERLQELMERKNRYYVESIEHLSSTDLLPGARELLEEIRAGGVKIAIGSASKNAQAVIEKLGIEPFVDAVADGSSVSRQKPAPDLFLHAAKLLGFPPNQCVVFEDAGAGVQAALAGGMWAVGIGPQERVGAAHLVIPGFEGLSWEAIIGKLVQPDKNETKGLHRKGSL